MQILIDEKISDIKWDDEGFSIITPSGEFYFGHSQDCCEDVHICSDIETTGLYLLDKTIKAIKIREVELSDYSLATFFDIITDTYTGTIQFHGSTDSVYTVDVDVFLWYPSKDTPQYGYCALYNKNGELQGIKTEDENGDEKWFTEYIMTRQDRKKNECYFDISDYKKGEMNAIMFPFWIWIERD